MKNNRIDSCCSSFTRYNWPDLMKNANLKTSIEIKDFANGLIEVIDPMKEMEKILDSATFSLTHLPKVYQGIVRRDILDEIKEKSGSFFPGPSPDIANAVGVCLLSRRCIFVHSPIIIAGFSKNSASGMGTTKQHIDLIENVPWLDKSVKETWDRRIPAIWSGQTIWAESMIKALQKMGRDDLVQRFNFRRLYSSFLMSHRKFTLYIFRTKGRDRFLFLLDIPVYVIYKIKSKIVGNDTSDVIVVSEDKIELRSAIELLGKYIERNPVDYSGYNGGVK